MKRLFLLNSEAAETRLSLEEALRQNRPVWE